MNIREKLNGKVRVAVITTLIVGTCTFLATKALNSTSEAEVRQLINDTHPRLPKVVEFDQRLDDSEKREEATDAKFELILKKLDKIEDRMDELQRRR